MSYYFLAASLPRLVMDESPVMTPDVLRTACLTTLSPGDFQALGDALDGHRGTHPFLRDWSARETQLRNAVARRRATRRHLDPSSWLRDHEGFDVSIEQQVDAAFQLSDPLQREQALDRLRWRLIEELQQTDAFSSRAILGYALKLKLALRWGNLDEAGGRERMDAVLSPATDNPESETEDAS